MVTALESKTRAIKQHAITRVKRNISVRIVHLMMPGVRLKTIEMDISRASNQVTPLVTTISNSIQTFRRDYDDVNLVQELTPPLQPNLTVESKQIIRITTFQLTPL